MLHILTHSIQCLSMRGSFTLNRSKDIWQCLFVYLFTYLEAGFTM